MPALTPEMQVFTRNVRRMLRHRNVHFMYGARGARCLQVICEANARKFTAGGKNAPKFLMRKHSLMVQRLLRLMEEERNRWTFQLLEKFGVHLFHTAHMLLGTFHEPCAALGECSICLCRGSGRWWKSSSCGHCFHVRCINTHFNYDTRCPLCRGEI